MSIAEKVFTFVGILILSFFILSVIFFVWLYIETEKDKKEMGIMHSINECIEEVRKSTQKEYDEITELICEPGQDNTFDGWDCDLLSKLVNLESITITYIGDSDAAQIIFNELAKLPQLRSVEIINSEVGVITELSKIKNLSSLSFISQETGDRFKIDDLDSLGTSGSFLNLKSIKIDNCGIEELPDLSALTELNSLTINDFSVTALDYDSVNWSGLVNLDLSYTNIENLDNRIVENLYNLESLDISYTDINDIHFVLGLPKLTSFLYLYLKDFSINMEPLKEHPNFEPSWLNNV